MELPDDVESVDDVEWEDDEDAGLFAPMVGRARDHLDGLPWCGTVDELYVGIAVPDVLAVFLANVTPAGADADDWWWVVIGDVPTAHLPVHGVPTSSDALRRYCGEMSRWVDAVRTGRPLDDLLPVNVEPTEVWAGELANRVDFIRTRILEDGEP